MARVVISFSGEGRGHAARVLSLIQALRTSQLYILCPQNMLQFMEESTQNEPHVQLLAIPSLNFRYDANGRLSYVRSCFSAVPFLFRMRSYLRELTEVIDQFNPHLAIVDFEPLLPRITHQLGITTLSLDHQHFLAALDLRTLPWELRVRAEFLRPSIKLFCPWADAHLISSFYRFPQRAGTTNYRQVGVLIREELGQLPSQVGEHLLVYLRRNKAGAWLEQLKRLGRPCVIYGQDRQGRDENLVYKPISSREFIRDLASCRCLISTAGNQLIGEALAVGKPVLAIPERGNFEQQINGHFLHDSGLGRCLSPAKATRYQFECFLDDLPMFRERIDQQTRTGNHEVLQQIQQMFPFSMATKANLGETADLHAGAAP
ncbi:MAG: hypothetical protein JNL67_19410 [Planctomycetaceae bacterium]|nr:hypothetical protein [Planctomycetaceae bacterium]